MIAILGVMTRIVAGWVCHQLPERSFVIAGVPLPVCARCTGIYLGALLALIMRGRSRRTMILAALALVGLDWASEALGLRPAWATLRILTGAFLGYSAMPALIEGLRERRA